LTYTYDALNRLASVKDNRMAALGGPSTPTTYSYDPVGNLFGYVYPNTVQTSNVFDTLHRLTQACSATSSRRARQAPSCRAMLIRWAMRETLFPCPALKLVCEFTLTLHSEIVWEAATNPFCRADDVGTLHRPSSSGEKRGDCDELWRSENDCRKLGNDNRTRGNKPCGTDCAADLNSFKHQ